WIAACIILAIWSDAPPAPAATTISTGLVGSQANAALESARAARPVAMRMLVLMSSSFVWRVRLGDFAGRRLCALREIVHRGDDAALLHRHAGERETHLDAGERAHQHEIVEVTEMADAEHVAAELGEAGAERKVERLEDHLAHATRGLARRHQPARERRP